MTKELNVLLLNREIQEFINQHLESDLTKLLLKGIPFNNIDPKELIQQIESKKKSQKKLPTWFETSNIYYPNKLNIEQTSSEITANYKSSLIEGTNLIDLTGGFGVDAYYFSKRFDTVTHCEINEELSTIVHHNYQELQVQNIMTVAEDGIEFLKENAQQYDWIFVDPSRRHDSKGKVFFLEDCIPNIPKELPLLFQHSNQIMIKTSPLLDISVGMKELKSVKEIQVIAVNNEVKELLWILEKEHTSEVVVKTMNLKASGNEEFRFSFSHESAVEADYSKPLRYLYEPNAAILKAGAFNSVAVQTKTTKLHKHSHLYTSEELIDFPGRRFKIESLLPYSKKAVKLQSISKANVTTRNFPETVQQIRKKLSLNDGGSVYLYFTTNCNNEKIVLVCSKIN